MLILITSDALDEQNPTTLITIHYRRSHSHTGIHHEPSLCSIPGVYPLVHSSTCLMTDRRSDYYKGMSHNEHTYDFGYGFDES